MTETGTVDPSVRPTLLERYGISPILFAFLSLIVVFLLYQGVGALVTVALFGLKLTREDATGLRMATLLAQVFLLLGPALLLTRLATRNVRDFLRLQAPRASLILIPFAGIFSLQQMLQVYMAFQEKIPLPEPVRSVVDQFKQLIEETYRILVGTQSVGELLFVIMVIALTPAIAEEVLFRGLIQKNFERALGPRIGICLCALIFAAYHLNPFSFIPLVGLGLYLGFLVSWSNSLWVSVAAHFYNNLFACVAIYLGMEENFVVTPDPTHPGNLLLTFFAFSLVFVVSTYYFARIAKASARTNNFLTSMGASS